jgi:cyclic pyranopterin phosphate synthase
LNAKGDEVSMVDVGSKSVSRRIALARSVVVFPPEVMSALGLQQGIESTSTRKELSGPKGPIFSTAKLAGIMGAKRTSDLIPLCHPLPLDKVDLDITLVGNKAIIECECRVTHKTGVEMEVCTHSSSSID